MGSIASKICGRKTMCRVLGPKTQKRIYRWPMEAQRREKNMQRMRRSPRRKWRTLAIAGCSCWREPTQFPPKRQKPHCSFYRVCLTCKETKACDLCGKHLEEKDFSKSEWQRTRNKVRVCTACHRQGHWTCSVCKTRRLLTHFSLWRKQHPAHYGTQKCNICIHVKHARQQTHARLKRTRSKIKEAKVTKVLQEVRIKIQQIKRKQQTESGSNAKSQKTVKEHSGEHKEACIHMSKPHAHIQVNTEIPQVNEQQGSHGQDHRNAKKPSAKLLEYECPYCHVTIYSPVESGQVQVTGHCGKRFRVHNGVVTRSFTHTTKESGKIQSKHKTPDGKTCTMVSWVSKESPNDLQ